VELGKYSHACLGGDLKALFSCIFQNSKFLLRHLYGALNLDEIKKLIAQFDCKLRDESNEPN